MASASEPTAASVGAQRLTAVDPADDIAIDAWLLYPSDAPATPLDFGPYRIDLALDGRLLPGDEARPLVLVSHGNGGSPWTHRGLAARLVHAGFDVALLEHPGNHRGDNRLAGTARNLLQRPRHLARVLDAAVAWRHRSGRKPAAVAAIGHSIGAYTALALAGGRPTPRADETADGRPAALDTVADARIGALVLLAPAAAWFMAEGALDAVTVPTLMLTGEHDDLATPFHAELVRRGLAGRAPLQHRVVPGAGHFSFQSPFPPALQRPDFPPAHDPPGFDRAAFEPRLAAEIAAFLNEALRAAAACG